tara:strand:+ start:1867 stop:2646 length:780 start_codon:yes stop_codon:yes gene_type:complete
MILNYKNSILNIDYYNKNIEENYITIFSQYNKLIIEYLKHCYDTVCIQNLEYKNYVIKQGISTIKHIFRMLLIYTKNLEMTVFNCQKAYVYYIEFIGQISENNHSFLQLNSKDASLFVYKKTIFDINNDIIKNYTSSDNVKNITKILDPMIDIYNSILFKLLNEYNSSEIIKIVNIDFQKIIQKIIKLFIDIDNITILNKINLFIVSFKDKNLIENIDLFIKKLKKKDYNYRILELEIINQQNDNISANNYINNIFNNL